MTNSRKSARGEISAKVPFYGSWPNTKKMVPTIVMSIKEILEELPKLTPEEKRQLWKVSLAAYADPLEIVKFRGQLQ